MQIDSAAYLDADGKLDEPTKIGPAFVKRMRTCVEDFNLSDSILNELFPPENKDENE